MFPMHLPSLSGPSSLAHSRFRHARLSGHHSTQLPKPSTPYKPTLVATGSLFAPKTGNLCLISKCMTHSAISISTDVKIDDELTKHQKAQEIQESTHEKSFWGAVSLVVGTAVGPGMLGLPATTITSGPFPSTIVILLSWVYVISSIILVAELTFAVMEEDEVEEVSFTGLVTKALGSNFGAFVALVYASLSFSLLVACVSGIGSLVSQWFPRMNLVMANVLFPLLVGTVILFFPFKAIDSANRLLCFVMLFSIVALVAIGLSVARTAILGSFSSASWSFSSIAPAIPVIVLTLGFHVITPFICKIAGNTVHDARKAILVGGAVPLLMVLSWNLIVLGLAGANGAISRAEPISFLLSVNPSALSAIQGFAFAALATSFIGYAVSFPKQLLDTWELVFGKIGSSEHITASSQKGSDTNGIGGVGFSVHKILVMMMALGSPVLIASFFPSIFSKALDFAGLYANCFLFGIIPPAVAYIYQSRNKLRPSVLPGGDATLLLLFCTAVILGIWH